MTNFKLASKLVVIHAALIAAMFIYVAMSSNWRALNGWNAFFVIDFPSSLAVKEVDNLFWQTDTFWYSGHSWVRRFSRRCGLDHLNVGVAVLFLPAGTLQWALVGYVVQSVYRKRNVKRMVHPGITS